MIDNSKKYDLIVIIVKKGLAEEVIKTANKVGASGSTVIHGRGSSVHETTKIFGVPIEPEKEIILLVVEKKDASIVLQEITDKVELNKPGIGIGFVLEVEKAVGVNVKND